MPGEAEPPLPEVRGAHFGRAEHRPLRIVPELGQAPEYVGDRPIAYRSICGVVQRDPDRIANTSVGAEDPGHVLEVDPRWLDLADDSRDVIPEPSLVVGPTS